MKNINKLWRTKNYLAALAIALIALFWMNSRPTNSLDHLQTGPRLSEPNLTKVQVARLQTKPYQLKVHLSARTEPNRIVDLKAELEGRITRLPLEKGSMVKTDDVVCELAIEDRQQRVNEAKSALQHAWLEYEGAQQLNRDGLGSEVATAASQAKLQRATAILEKAKVDLANINIRAPFAGILDTRPVELGEYMQKGDVCARVIDLNPMVLKGRVSESDVIMLGSGNTAKATLHSGQKVIGRIRYIGREPDQITRTFPLEITIDNAGGQLLAGMTAKVELPLTEMPAYHVRSSLLTLDDNGSLGLHIVDEQQIVRFYPVTIIGSDHNGIWLTGIPDGSLLITMGQEYVSPGEKVNYMLDQPLDNISEINKVNR